MLDGTHYFDCTCGSSEHTLRFILDKKDNEVYIEIYLNQYRPIWKRVWVGIKYMFGYKCVYGHWDCWMLDPDDMVRLRDLCDEMIEAEKTTKANLLR